MITRLFLSMTTQEQNNFLNSDTNEQVNLIKRSLERRIDDSEMGAEEIRRGGFNMKLTVWSLKVSETLLLYDIFQGFLMHAVQFCNICR